MGIEGELKFGFHSLAVKGGIDRGRRWCFVRWRLGGGERRLGRVARQWIDGRGKGDGCGYCVKVGFEVFATSGFLDVW